MVNFTKRAVRQKFIIFTIFFIIISFILIWLTYFHSNRAAFEISSFGSFSAHKSTRTPKTGPASIRPDSDCPSEFNGIFNSLISIYRRCLLEKIEKKSKWNALKPAVESCLGETLWKIFDVHLLNNWDDIKLVILPKNNQSEFNCIQMTLGVGNDIEAEKKLRNLLPNCRFYGADPIPASGKIFKEMGEYFDMAVSAQAGVLKASVLENGRYQDKKVETVTFTDFVTNITKIDHIDYLFMDNEGPEYELMKPGTGIETANISVCQISIEMHGPLENYGMNEKKYDEFIESIIKKSAFLPIWTTTGGVHVRSYYLNVIDQYCLDTFYMRKFCNED